MSQSFSSHADDITTVLQSDWSAKILAHGTKIEYALHHTLLPRAIKESGYETTWWVPDPNSDETDSWARPVIPGGITGKLTREAMAGKGNA